MRNQSLSPRRQGFRTGAVLGVGVGAVAAGAVYRRELASMMAGVRAHDRLAIEVTKPALIINRWSGGGKADQIDLASLAKDRGVEVTMLERGDDLVDLAERAVANGADALGMAGGDGSLGLVAGVAAAHDLPFFCVPVGTRNHFALDVGLDRDDPAAALEAITSGVATTIDHGVVGERVFLNNVSLGVYPAAVKRDGYRDAKVATFFSVAGEASAGAEPGTQLRFAGPDGIVDGYTPMVLVANNPYVMSGPPDFGRRIRLDAGVLGIMAVLPTSAASPSGPPVQTWTASTLRIEASADSIDVGVDGESIPMPSPLDITIRPHSLNVLVPAGTRPGYRPNLRRRRPVLDHLVELLGEPD